VGLVARFGPFEHHKMPNGTGVYYRDSDHTYHTGIRKDGKKWVGKGRWGDLPSPSQIAKFADPNPDNLMGWAARKTLEGVMQLGTLDFVTDAEQLHDVLQSQGLTWRDLRDDKGDIGTVVHGDFEKLLAGTLPEELEDDIPEGALGYVRGLVRFFEDLGEFELLQSEPVVYSRQHGYAGRFDARIKVPLITSSGISGYQTWLLDLKTSGFIGRSSHNQLVGYDLAAQECGYGASDQLLILQVLPEPDERGNTYRLWPCRGTRAGFLLNLSSYKDGKRMDAETKADFKRIVKGAA
jgi:hypothetical protein